MRESFVLYCEYQQHLKLLEPSEQGNLLMALFDYVSNGIEPNLEGMTAIAFSFIRSQIDRDSEKYQKTIDARKEAGRKGGRAKQKEANQANANFAKQSKANQAVNVNDNVNVNVNDKNNNVEQSTTEYPYKDVIDYLNQKIGTQFKDKSKDSRKHIKARFDDGFVMDDFVRVIDKKAAEWTGTDNEKYLRPCTLFGTKFESYLNQHDTKKVTKANNFTGRKYDMDSLEGALLDAN
ncbi:MAG: conserved phage C-terminal domain-containing protein [Hespellia sp.]|nr:conserved phage C-terminal domain-containing protein [Hespellia sp.]